MNNPKECTPPSQCKMVQFRGWQTRCRGYWGTFGSLAICSIIWRCSHHQVTGNPVFKAFEGAACG